MLGNKKIVVVIKTMLLLMITLTIEAHDMNVVHVGQLGVPGYLPECKRLHPHIKMSVKDAAQDLICHQKKYDTATDEPIHIGMVGDSITAGVHSSSSNHTYPSQLQAMLDEKYGDQKYAVTNLGACGSTMLKDGNSPYWKRPQYQTLIENKWDIVTIQLGTNDAKDKADNGPDNWKTNVCNGGTSLNGCTYANNYKEMINLIRTLGKEPGKSPKIYISIPPPLMEHSVYGMNQTVINTVLPKLIPLIGDANDVDGIINIYENMGGTIDNWKRTFPLNCTLTTKFQPCQYYCEEDQKWQCDQCHPDDNGYTFMASVFLKALGL